MKSDRKKEKERKEKKKKRKRKKKKETGINNSPLTRSAPCSEPRSASGLYSVPHSELDSAVCWAQR